MYAQFTDLIEGLALLKEAKNCGVLGVIVWYIKEKRENNGKNNI